MIDHRAGLVARVRRGDLVESAHLGHVVAVDAGGRLLDGRPDGPCVGDPTAVIFARSALKPVQAVAMLRAGLDLDGELLALASSSHSGEPEHLSGVRRILAGAGLAETDLSNTPAPPTDDDAAFAWRAAGHAPASITQNCSGKHAAMLATCTAAGWPIDGYLDPAHPLQRMIRAEVSAQTGDGEPSHLGVDGCGAPLFSCSLVGLARAFAKIATAAPGTPEARVAVAIRANPWWLGGTARTVTRLIETVPGLIAKDGAEGVFVAALPDGRALAVKIVDGSMRPMPAVVVETLRALGVAAQGLTELGLVAVLGHGKPVGLVEAGIA